MLALHTLGHRPGGITADDPSSSLPRIGGKPIRGANLYQVGFAERPLFSVKSTTTSVVPAVATRRLVGRFRGSAAGPTLVCIGSLHGNEPAGAEALHRICASLSTIEAPMSNGDFLAMAGNLAALQVRQRFVDADLNRHWTPERLAAVERGDVGPDCAEDGEMLALLQELTLARAQARGPIFLLDLHTTSGDSPPFATVGARAGNRRFALRFGAPVILGLQDGLRGTLLDFIESQGHTCMGFEGGQHTDPAAVESIEAVVWVALAELGLLGAEATPFAQRARQRLRQSDPPLAPQFEIVYRYVVDERSRFRMEPGWSSFQPVSDGELLASEAGAEVRASQPGRLLMPLYQEQGEDGFFLMQIYSPLRHLLCRLLSRLPLQGVLARLPGITANGDGSLLVDARWVEGPTQELLLLLGYRSRRQIDERTLVIHRRHR